MTTVTWSPAPGLLFALPETAGPIAYNITATVQAPEPEPGEGGAGDGGGPAPPAPTITGYDAHITPAQSIIEIAADASGIALSAATLAGLFPIDYIDYRAGGTITRIHDWADLPAGADHLIDFKPGTDTTRSYTLDATAYLSDATQAHAQYTFDIQHNWSAGRQRLVAEVNARRH